MGSIRQQIMDALVVQVASITGMAGAIDSRPWDYETPPRPIAGNGKPELPFAWVYEDEEPANDGESTDLVGYDLPINIEVAYRFTWNKAASQALEPLGRGYIAAIQTKLAAHYNLGGLARDVREASSVILQTPTEGIGVVLSRWIVDYVRDRNDPTLQVTAT